MRTIVPVVPLLVAGGCASAFIVWVALTSGLYSDFVAWHESARALLDGRNIYFTETSRVGWRNMNPPQFVALMAPLGLLGVRDALIVWWLLTAGAMFGCVRLWARALPAGWALSLFALLFASAAGYLNVRYGNQSWIAAYFVTWGWVAWREQRRSSAAAVLGAVASIKVFLFILLPYLCWRRQWRAAGAFVAAVVVALLFGAVVCGIDSYRSWLVALQGQTWQGQSLNMSTLGIVTRAFDRPMGELQPLVVAPALIRPAWVIVVAGLSALTWNWLRRIAHPDRDFAVLLTLMLLVTPAGWVYYLPLAAGPIAATLAVSSVSFWLWTAGVLALLFPYPFLLIGQFSAWSTLTIGSFYSWGGVLLLTACGRTVPSLHARFSSTTSSGRASNDVA